MAFAPPNELSVSQFSWISRLTKQKGKCGLGSFGSIARCWLT